MVRLDICTKPGQDKRTAFMDISTAFVSSFLQESVILSNLRFLDSVKYPNQKSFAYKLTETQYFL